MPAPHVNVAILWHMHQPSYRSPETGVSAMPWVRLHALKGYTDMLDVLVQSGEHARAIFNFVPSLVSQLQSYLDGSLTDDYLEVSRKPAEELSDNEREFIASNFFHANHRTMVDCYPRYRELRMKARLPGGTVRKLPDEDLRDLVVWFNLTWMGYAARRKHDLVEELVTQGSEFTEEQKSALLDLHFTVMGEILPAYRDAADSGSIELTTTPFYHPILPLLCDSDSAREGLPDRELPDPPFQARDDAAEQVRRAVEYHEEVFGRRPRGMWPAEGSVSPEAVEVIADHGIEWLTTDQDILFKSKPKLKRPALFQPYTVGEGDATVSAVFRERDIADAIGFRYASTSAKDAVEDFMGKLKGIRSSLPSDAGESIVTIVLDGENAWEYFPDGGEKFLSGMYQAVAEAEGFSWTTVSEYIDEHPPQKRIRKIFPGSWIGGNFDIWIGSEEENRGWEELRKARAALVVAEGDVGEEDLARAWEILYAAEGSDWFWWYGDDFSTALQPEFDKLFRAHLAELYRIIGKSVPREVLKPIKKGKAASGQAPTDLISPTIDGKVSNYYEWVGAGELDAARSDGAMARGDQIICKIYYGADHSNLYIRIDTEDPPSGEGLEGVEFACAFLSHSDVELRLVRQKGDGASLSVLFEGEGTSSAGGEAHADSIIECSASFMGLGFAPGEMCEFVVCARKDGEELERWPRDGLLAVEVPTDAYELEHWTA